MTASLTTLKALAARLLEAPPAAVQRMPGGGSTRRFYRFRVGEVSYVGVIGGVGETRTFLAFTRHFAARGVPVPRILGAEEEQGLYVMEDLGRQTLADRLAGWHAQPGGRRRALAALESVVGWLPAIQVGGASLDERLFIRGPRLDRQALARDVELFLEHYVGPFAPEYAPDDAARRDLERLAERLGAPEHPHFCYRDFQSRNIMWPNGGPVFLDYQSGRRGPVAYDLASLLYSPDSLLDEPARERLIDRYLDALGARGVRLERGALLAEFYPCVALRRLQALGAYGRLARQHGKEWFLDKVPATWATLRELLQREAFCGEYPAFRAWLGRLAGGARPG